MSSLDIFVENINRYAKNNNAKTYQELSKLLKVTEAALKHWENKTRCPSLKQIDQIADHIKCHSSALIQKNGDVFAGIENVRNGSHKHFLYFLRQYFMKKGKFSWEDKAALFYGFVSKDALKSYFRKEHFTMPPLDKLDEMAEAIGVPAYQLIEEDVDYEETDR